MQLRTEMLSVQAALQASTSSACMCVFVRGWGLFKLHDTLSKLLACCGCELLILQPHRLGWACKCEFEYQTPAFVLAGDVTSSLKPFALQRVSQDNDVLRGQVELLQGRWGTCAFMYCTI